MTTSKEWKQYLNKEVKLIIEDDNKTRSRDGIIIDIDDTHIFLQTIFKELPIPFSRRTIKRIEIQK